MSFLKDFREELSQAVNELVNVDETTEVNEKEKNSKNEKTDELNENNSNEANDSNGSNENKVNAKDKKGKRGRKKKANDNNAKTASGSENDGHSEDVNADVQLLNELFGNGSKVENTVAADDDFNMNTLSDEDIKAESIESIAEEVTDEIDEDKIIDPEFEKVSGEVVDSEELPEELPEDLFKADAGNQSTDETLKSKMENSTGFNVDSENADDFKIDNINLDDLDKYMNLDDAEKSENDGVDSKIVDTKNEKDGIEKVANSSLKDISDELKEEINEDKLEEMMNSDKEKTKAALRGQLDEAETPDYSSREDEEANVAADEVTEITKGTVLEGNIVAEGSMNVYGRIKGNVACKGKLFVTGTIVGSSRGSDVTTNNAKINGDVTSDGSLKIGNGSIVIGNVYGTSAVIAGAVQGDVDVQGPVIVDGTAVIQGNIRSRSVQINNGAAIEGNVSQCYAGIDYVALFDKTFSEQ